MGDAFPKFYLASQSPRRRQLLEALGISFTVKQPQVEEKSGGASSAAQISMQNAKAKADQVAASLDDPKSIVLGADTIVVLDEEILGKPSSKDSARSTLQKLSGRVHEVMTGVALVSPHYGNFESCVTSQIGFRRLTPAEIEAYVCTREPYDKAGAYAVQGLASLFVESVQGSYTNVIGLPIETFLQGLQKLTGKDIFQWFQ